MPTPHIGAEAITPVIQATGRIQGNHAVPVYVYTSIPSDRRGLGMAAQPVTFITDADLVENGGQYKLQGRLTALPVIQMPAGSQSLGMPAIPVYDVTNKDWPPAFNPVVPVPPPSFPPVTAGLLLNLQADALALNDGDPVTVWADASGLHHDFTRGAGSGGLTKQTDGLGNPYVNFDHTANDWMAGQNWADLDNMPSFALFVIMSPTWNDGFIIGKSPAVTDAPAWLTYNAGNDLDIYDAGATDELEVAAANALTISEFGVLNLYTQTLIDLTSGLQQRNGLSFPTSNTQHGVLTDYSTTAIVSLGSDAAHDWGFAGMQLRGLLLYSPKPSNADIAAINAACMSHYNIPAPTVPSFVSASIGPIDASTIEVQFSEPITEYDAGGGFDAGVAVKVNGVTAAFAGTTNHPSSNLVDYVLAAPVSHGDTVTWEYDGATGATYSRRGNPMATIAAQTVTNTV